MNIQDILRSAAAALSIVALGNPTIPSYNAQTQISNSRKQHYALQLQDTEQRLELKLDEILGVGTTFPQTNVCPKANSIAGCIEEASATNTEFTDDLHKAVRTTSSLDVSGESYSITDLKTIQHFLLGAYYAFADGGIPLNQKLERGLLNADKLNALSLPESTKQDLVNRVRALVAQVAVLDDIFQPIEADANAPVKVAEGIAARKATYDRLQHLGNGNGSKVHQLYARAAKMLSGAAPAQDEFALDHRVSTDLVGFYIQRNIVYNGLQKIFADIGIHIPDSTVPIYDSQSLKDLVGVLTIPSPMPIGAGFLPGKNNTTEDDNEALPSGNGLVDVLLAAGIPEEALATNQDLWEYLRTIENTGVISKNKTFYAADHNGHEWLVKLLTNKTAARMEAAASYYLGNHFDFIVPGKFQEPLEAGEGMYVVIQKSIRNQPLQDRGLNYWISSLALFHRQAKSILEEQGIVVPDISFRSVEEQQERYGQGRQNNDLRFNPQQWNDVLSYFQKSPHKTVIHHDPKSANIHGGFLLDYETIATGDAGIDLATQFARYSTPEEQWNQHLELYATLRGIKSILADEVRNLHQSTKEAMAYVIPREVIGSSLRTLTPATARENERLVHYLRSLSA